MYILGVSQGWRMTPSVKIRFRLGSVALWQGIHDLTLIHQEAADKLWERGRLNHTPPLVFKMPSIRKT